MGSIKKILTRAIFIVVFLVLAFVVFFLISLGSPGKGEKRQDFVVRSGWGAYAVAKELHQQGLIKSRRAFLWYLRLSGKINELKKGVYEIHDGMSGFYVADLLTSGRTKSISFTIPEGYNNRQIGDLLTEKGFFHSRAEFLHYASDKDLLEKYKIPAKTAEGYLFPETYTVPVGYDKKKIIALMIEQFFESTKDLPLPRDPVERHNLVILASIVEREAQVKEERPLIAGVFHNRLKANYPLESCATIQYLFERPKKKLYYKDLEINSPYNTYKHRGLPPSPISNPGLEAIKASLNPAQTSYKFFVVKGDGSHHFSQSYAEHLKMKKLYLGSH
ncbi:MAG: endolytic transglycosylase MltG [Leptospiraceae bacterium]|nr:endolytic transglycosylase MltG [Leptospiraceae bacterium]MDW8307493.1 endolytic transglycosylase MltG [Leptospiraceae bacterium]